MENKRNRSKQGKFDISKVTKKGDILVSIEKNKEKRNRRKR